MRMPRFPQSSTEKIPNLVTNNLYSEFANVPPLYVRAILNISATGSALTQKNEIRASNSFFRNILHATPSESICCGRVPISCRHNLNKINILRDQCEKMLIKC
jgi:hypothetical protein